MNAITTTTTAARLTPVEAFLGQVLRPQDRGDIERSLPAHVSFDRFERNLTNAIMNNPKLLECKPREVFREVAKIAALGLVLDAQLGEAYLITGYGQGGPAPQARIGYRGLIKLARQSGDVASIYAHEVCANDSIELEYGTEKRLFHRPNVFGDRGDIIGFYAAVKYKDGDTDFEAMSIGQIEAHRDQYSDGWKAFKNKKIKDTPWNSNFPEMAKKTCIRRLIKRIPQSPDLHQAVRYEEEADAFSKVRELPPRASRAIAAPIEDEAADEAQEASPLPPRASQAAIEQHQPPRASQAAAPADESDPIDWDAQLTSYDDALSSCEAIEDLNENVSAMGSVFVDAPEAIRAEAAKTEAANRARIERAA